MLRLWIATSVVAGFVLLVGAVLAAPLPRDLPPAAGQERTLAITKEVGITFCWIPAGECQLGSTKKEQEMVEESQLQVLIIHRVKPQEIARMMAKKDRSGWKRESEATRGKFTTRGFWLGKFQVTQEQWFAVMGDDDLPFAFRKGGKSEKLVAGLETRNFPAESVTWDECVAFAGKLQERLGRDAGIVRLPHENEWEYACRGGKGNGTPYYFGSACNGKEGNCFGVYPMGDAGRGKSVGRLTAVGSYAKVSPHPWGLCDMGFNVREWCENPFAKDSELRTARGGYWAANPWQCRSATRWSVEPSERTWDTGLRVVLSPQ